MAAMRHLILSDPWALVWPAAIFVAVFAAGWLVRRLLLGALNAWTKRTASRPGRILTDSLRGPLLIWALILGVHLALQASGLPDRYTRWSAGILFVLWALSLVILCMRVSRDVIRYYGAQIPGALPVTTLTQNLAELAVVLLGIVVLGWMWGRMAKISLGKNDQLHKDKLMCARFWMERMIPECPMLLERIQAGSENVMALQ